MTPDPARRFHRPPLLLVAVLLAGCAQIFGGGNDSPPIPGVDDDDSSVGEGYLGDPCSGNEDCLGSYVCAAENTCQEAGTPGTTPEGGACGSSDSCAAGLSCAASQTCELDGSAGTTPRGESCEADEQCQAFLSCSGGTCSGFQPPYWPGVSCPGADADTGTFRVYFEVPGDEPPSEFYRLPFPNDIRITDGTIDLSGHPSPGALIPAVGDVVGEIFSILEQDLHGWGTNQGVFFRFSGRVDFDSIELGPPGEGNVGIIDIEPGSADYALRHSGGWYAASQQTPYICRNWLHLRIGDGRPLLPNHTYAALVMEGVLQRDFGNGARQDPDFTAMLGDSAPEEQRLASAWAKYAPLRLYLADQGIDPGSVAGAAVFTTQDVHEPMRLLRQAVLAEPAPVVDGLYLCASDDAGPYADPDDPERGCFGENDAFHEIQGTVTIPQFQAGTPPFKEVVDGGAIDFSSGPPTAQRTEAVQFALSWPKNVTLPAAGLPLVIYAHGTGGNYRSGITSMAAQLSSVVLDDGTEVQFALLAYDGVMHGPRRHRENWDPSWLAIDGGAYDPDTLFYSGLNPRAARDNPLQGSADGFQILRMAQDIDWDAASSPTGEPIRVDPSQIYFLGHSQGSTTGVAFVAWEPEIQAAVFSGAGGLLIESLINKTQPYDLPAALAVGLADLDIRREHPILNLVQAGAERSDAINHGRQILVDPLDGNPAKHVFMTYGIGDSYTPDVTQHALARSLGVEQAPGPNEALGGLGVEELPTSGNRNSHQTTAMVGLYQAISGDDAHFVLFDRADAQRQATHFLGTAVRDGVPTVVAP